MKLRILKFGKPAHSQYGQLVEKIEERISRFVKFERVVMKSSQDRDKDSTEILKLRTKSKREIMIVCDERGQDLTSKDLAGRIRQFEADPSVDLVTFVIGGPYGINDEVREAANFVWRMGHGVLPSDLAWLTCTEQIYRAYCVNHNIAYHHE